MELKNLEENYCNNQIFWCVSGTCGVCAEQVNYRRTEFSNFTFPQKRGKNYASYLFLLSSLPQMSQKNTHVHCIVNVYNIKMCPKI